MLHHLLQKRNQLVCRLFPVAVLSFLLQGHFGKSTGTSFRNKNGVVSKASCSSFILDYCPFADAFKQVFLMAPQQGYYGTEPGGALGVVSEFAQQFFNVLFE